jgi:hypothetical protein
MDKDANEVGILTGKAPRQVALKAANRCCAEITLKRAKKKCILTGERKQAKKPKGASAWMPAKIWKPSVKKAGVVKLEDL